MNISSYLLKQNVEEFLSMGELVEKYQRTLVSILRPPEFLVVDQSWAPTFPQRLREIGVLIFLMITSQRNYFQVLEENILGLQKDRRRFISQKSR